MTSLLHNSSGDNFNASVIFFAVVIDVNTKFSFSSLYIVTSETDINLDIRISFNLTEFKY